MITAALGLSLLTPSARAEEAAEASVHQLRTNAPPSVSFSFFITNFTVDVAGYPYDGDGTVTWYLIDFGDGATSNDLNARHTYSAPGVYTLTATVIDNDGAMSGYRQSVYISGHDST